MWFLYTRYWLSLFTSRTHPELRSVLRSLKDFSWSGPQFQWFFVLNKYPNGFNLSARFGEILLSWLIILRNHPTSFTFLGLGSSFVAVTLLGSGDTPFPLIILSREVDMTSVKNTLVFIECNSCILEYFQDCHESSMVLLCISTMDIVNHTFTSSENLWHSF